MPDKWVPAEFDMDAAMIQYDIEVFTVPSNEPPFVPFAAYSDKPICSAYGRSSAEAVWHVAEKLKAEKEIADKVESNRRTT